MIEIANSLVHAVDNADYPLAVKASRNYTVDQIDDFAREAGLGDFISGAGRVALRSIGRESARLLLQENPSHSVKQARLDAGFDEPVATTLKGWSLAVSEKPFTENGYTFDTGVDLVAGMRKTCSSKLVRVPLDLAITTWLSGNINMQLGQRQFDAPDTMYADRDNQLLEIANRFLYLVATS
jgi:hypothetical protein